MSEHVTGTGLQPRVGDECWFVEWCVALAFDSVGDVDRDGCTMERRQVATEAEAEQLAREIWPQTHGIFGIVNYWPARFVAYEERYPWAGYWQHGESKVYEGE
ncbi:MAG: hypothetical protein JO110_14625 [Acetobacteraceae bacterium]|nr:hypothetical protein [Acetobacteraceae bacterium]